MSEEAPKRFYASPEEQSEYLARVYADHVPAIPVKAVYGFGCLDRNETSVLQQLYWSFWSFWSYRDLSRDIEIVIPGHEKYITPTGAVGYSGSKAWREALCETGLPPGIIIETDLCTAPDDPQHFNTYTESLAFVKLAMEKNWQTVVIVAFPAHLPRAFASMVSAGRKLGWAGKVYAKCGATLPWQERVRHSHISVPLSRAESVGKEEHPRLEAYCTKGDLLSARELLAYMNERDLTSELEKNSG